MGARYTLARSGERGGAQQLSGATGVSQKSSVLVEHSFQYQKSAKDLRRMMLLKKWMPIIVIVAVLVLFILFRWYY